jgi:hypothetical protein
MTVYKPSHNGIKGYGYDVGLVFLSQFGALSEVSYINFKKYKYKNFNIFRNDQVKVW